MTASGFPCPECGGEAAPVWATYHAEATVDGERGHGTLRLPLHRCDRGHVSGWRPADDFLADLAIEVVATDYEGLDDATVAPRKRMLGRPRCGGCGHKLALVGRGRRLAGTLRRTVRGCADPVEFELDIPAMVCSACGARPDIDHRAIAGTAADIETWLFQLLADAMPPERATEIRPRA